MKKEFIFYLNIISIFNNKKKKKLILYFFDLNKKSSKSCTFNPSGERFKNNNKNIVPGPGLIKIFI
jgi:hypothetical protein